jgi:hypothetical protein
MLNNEGLNKQIWICWNGLVRWAKFALNTLMSLGFVSGVQWATVTFSEDSKSAKSKPLLVADA